MEFKKGQKFKVKDVSSFKDNSNFFTTLSGGIVKRTNGHWISPLFNDEMLKAKEAVVDKVVGSSCFIGTDGWYWYDWMIVNPAANTLMTTE